MNKKLIPIFGAIAICFSAALWALDGAVLRPRLYHLDPFIVVFLEHTIAFVLMMFLLAYFFQDLKELKKLDIKDWSAFFWVALFGGAIGTIAITKAYFAVFIHQISSISVVVLLQKTQPIFAIILAIFILKERPKKAFYCWAVLAIVASYLIAFGFSQPPPWHTEAIYVPLFALLAAFAFGSSTVFGKHAVKKVSFRVATYIRFGLTSLITLIMIASLTKFDSFAAVKGADLTTLLIIACSTGGVAIFIYYWGLKRVMASKATIYEMTYPVVAIMLDYFLHDHVMNIGQWVGAVLLILSIYMIVNLNREKK